MSCGITNCNLRISNYYKKNIFFSEQFSFFSKSAYTNIIVLQKKITKVIAKTVIKHAIEFSLNNCYNIRNVT